MEKVIEYINDGNHVYIGGKAGTGKSWIIKRLRDHFPEKNVVLTATTGIAAVNIGGKTIHSFMGIGVGTLPLKQIVSKICSRKYLREQIWGVDVLIVDEISMLGAKILCLINDVLQAIRSNKDPFGGVQMVFTGDVLQLPPVKDDFFFTSDVWESIEGENCKVVYLTEPKRYEDVEYFYMLNRFRDGTFTDNDYEKLKSSCMDPKETASGIRPTMLFSTKAVVGHCNGVELKKLKGEKRVYKASDSWHKPLSKTAKAIYLDIAKDAIRDEITIAVGAQVMLKKNIDVTGGLCNGSRGVVKEIMPNGDLLIQFIGRHAPYQVTSQGWEFCDEKGGLVLARHQMPVILAWALTIHKTQSLTIDYVGVDLSNIFAAGQAYVALSRARTLEGLFITGLEKESFIVDEEAKQFEEKIVSMANE